MLRLQNWERVPLFRRHTLPHRGLPLPLVLRPKLWLLGWWHPLISLLGPPLKALVSSMLLFLCSIKGLPVTKSRFSFAVQRLCLVQKRKHSRASKLREMLCFMLLMPKRMATSKSSMMSSTNKASWMLRKKALAISVFGWKSSLRHYQR